VLLSSKAFVDFSTSGLENPLTHLFAAGISLRSMALAADVPSCGGSRSSPH
jgi:hypothetical protein